MELLLIDFNILFDIIGLIAIGGAITVGGDATTWDGDVTGETDLDLAIPELWASAIYGYFEAALVLRPICDDYSALVKGKGDAINIPEIPEVTGLADKTEGTMVVYGDEALVDTNILINKHKYVAKMFEDLGVIQANEPLFSKYAQAMGYQLAKQVDTDIIVELDDLGTTQALAVDNTLSIADAETAVATMLSNNLDPADCVWIINTTMYADLLAQGMLTHSSLTNAATTGNNTQGINFSSPTAGGTVPQFFGMPVITTSMIGAATGTGNEVGYCVKKGAVALAVQQEVRVQTEYSVDFLATKMVADCIYGVEKMTANKVMGIELLNP
jgi:hypothetical protein